MMAMVGSDLIVSRLISDDDVPKVALVGPIVPRWQALVREGRAAVADQVESGSKQPGRRVGQRRRHLEKQRSVERHMERVPCEEPITMATADGRVNGQAGLHAATNGPAS